MHMQYVHEHVYIYAYKGILYVNMYIYTHIYMNIYICIYICTYIYIHMVTPPRSIFRGLQSSFSINICNIAFLRAAENAINYIALALSNTYSAS